MLGLAHNRPSGTSRVCDLKTVGDLPAENFVASAKGEGTRKHALSKTTN